MPQIDFATFSSIVFWTAIIYTLGLLLLSLGQLFVFITSMKIIVTSALVARGLNITKRTNRTTVNSTFCVSIANTIIMETQLFDVSTNFLINTAQTALFLPNWLSYTFILFIGGLFGILFNYKNLLITILSIEIMYLGAISSFVLYSATMNNREGAVYGLILLILAACESGIGLGILIVLHRFGNTIDLKAFEVLHG